MDNNPLLLEENALQALSALPQPIWIFDPETLRILWNNPACEEWLEISAAELQSKTILDLRPPSDHQALRAALIAFQNETTFTSQWTLQSKTSKSFKARFHWQRCALNQKIQVLATINDVTDTHETLANLDRAKKLIDIAGTKAKLGGWRMSLGSDHVSWTPQTAAIHDAPYEPAPSAEEAFSYYLPAYRQKIEKCYTECITEGKPYDEILQIKTRSNRIAWVRAIGEPELDSLGNIIGAQGAFQDITELIHEKNRNSDLEQRLFSTLENMSDSFFMISTRFDFVYLNPRAENLLKRRREDLIGKNIWQEFPEARNTPVYSLYQQAIDTGNAIKVKFFYPPLDTWFEVNGYPTSEGLGVYFRDVTNEENQQQAAKLLHERFVLVSKATNDVIWDWDLIKNELWWNESMSRVFGYELLQLEPGPESWTTRIHPDDSQRVLESIHQVIDGTGTHWSNEYRFAKSSGKYALVHDRGFVIRDEQGKAIRMLGSMLDLTETRELEEKLRESQKLEAMGQLTGGVAHDFNNLLTVIMGNAETLAYRLKDNPQLQSLAEMTSKAAERGAELTSRLLSFARRQPLQPKTVDAGQLIQDSLALFRRILPETIEIEAPDTDGLWKIAVDPGQLEVALLNLVINGRDAIPQAGKLHISALNTELDSIQTDAKETLPAGPYVLISVRDTGHGMTQETLNRAFEPFFTTKEVGKGSGLGLSMVFGFVKQSKGYIKIHSAPNSGTCVELYFPKFAPETP